MSSACPSEKQGHNLCHPRKGRYNDAKTGKANAGMSRRKEPLIAINALLASGSASYRSAGIHAYIAHLLRHLPHVDDLRFVAIAGRNSRLEGTLSYRYSAFPTEQPSFRILYEQMYLPLLLQRIEAALFHGTAFAVPVLTAVPQVVTIHDLSFLRYPHFFRRGNRLYLRTMTRLSARKAAAVIAVSRFTAAEVNALLGIPRERIHVIYHGVEPRFRPLPRETVEAFRRRKGLPKRYILHLGTLEPRKNLPTLIRAFARLKDQSLHLVIAGGKGWFYETIFSLVEALGLEERIHFPGYVSSEEQPLWYNAATIFVALSHYEGFGLPLLEAEACGLPVVASDCSSLPEAAGKGAILVPPTDEVAVAEAMRKLLNDAALRAEIRQAGMEHSRRFTWERTAQETVKLYRKVLQGSER